MMRYLRHECQQIVVAVLGLCLGVLSNHSVVSAMEPPSIDAIMEDLHLSESDKQRILDGKIVDWSTGEGSDRELALGMALFVKKAKPVDMAKRYLQAFVLQKIPVVTGHGQITGDGSPHDFAGLALQPNPEKEARRYLEVEPGSDLNLDAKEMAAFRALKTAEPESSVPVQKVEALVRQMLLARH